MALSLIEEVVCIFEKEPPLNGGDVVLVHGLTSAEHDIINNRRGHVLWYDVKSHMDKPHVVYMLALEIGSSNDGPSMVRIPARFVKKVDDPHNLKYRIVENVQSFSFAIARTGRTAKFLCVVPHISVVLWSIYLGPQVAENEVLFVNKEIHSDTLGTIMAKHALKHFK